MKKFIIVLTLAMANSYAFSGIDSGGADGVSTANIIFDQLEGASFQVEEGASVIFLEATNIVCTQDSTTPYVNLCSAYDVIAGERRPFSANNFIDLIRAEVPQAIFEREKNDEINYFVKDLRCQKSFLVNTDSNEDVPFDDSYSCSIKAYF